MVSALNQSYGLKQSQINYLVNAAKIAIIVSMGIFLLGFFFAFYEYPNDARGYGLYSITLSSGQYEYTNELLETTQKWEFVPTQVKTIHNTVLPDSMPGIAFVGAIAYIVAGHTGLFYLGPLVMI